MGKAAGTSVVSWDKRLADDAARYQKAASSIAVGQFISLKGAQLSIDGTPVPGNKLSCVIIDGIMENDYFTSEYDSDAFQPPACFAFGRDDAEAMVPHEKAADPQSESCSTCKHNKFGSAKKGRGKACQNRWRLALMHADSLKGDIQAARVLFLKIPPTSLASWGGYMNQLKTAFGKPLPPYAVVTEISVTGDKDTQFKVGFRALSQIKDKKLEGPISAKHDETAAMIDFPYQPAEPKKRQSAAKEGARRKKF